MRIPEESGRLTSNALQALPFESRLNGVVGTAVVFCTARLATGGDAVAHWCLEILIGSRINGFTFDAAIARSRKRLDDHSFYLWH